MKGGMVGLAGAGEHERVDARKENAHDTLRTENKIVLHSLL